MTIAPNQKVNPPVSVTEAGEVRSDPRRLLELAPIIAEFGKAQFVAEALSISDDNSANQKLKIAQDHASDILHKKREVCPSGVCKHQRGDDQALCNALNEFDAAGKLDDAARDIIAATILLPSVEEDWRWKSFSDNDLLLADIYGVPIGAIVLRKKILHTGV